MPTRPIAGRSLVTRRAVVDLVRSATLGSYGVTGFASGPIEGLLGRIGVMRPGISVHLGTVLDIELDVTVAAGIPVAEVARQLESAVRHTVRRALAIEVGRLVIHVDGLRPGPGAGSAPAGHGHVDAIGPRDLADSGTDVA